MYYYQVLNVSMVPFSGIYEQISRWLKECDREVVFVRSKKSATSFHHNFKDVSERQFQSYRTDVTGMLPGMWHTRKLYLVTT